MMLLPLGGRFYGAVMIFFLPFVEWKKNVFSVIKAPVLLLLWFEDVLIRR